jgi:hypothetical protein
MFAWEEELLTSLIEFLPTMVLVEEEDNWRWALDESGMFTVKSTYTFVASIFAPETLLDAQVMRVLDMIWKNPSPSKVLAFSWRLLRNRLPTKDNLVQRGINANGGDNNCVHCQGREEGASHLFLNCDFAWRVWNDIFRWLGLVFVMPANVAMFYECFLGAAGSKKRRIGFSLIWHATVWMLWKSRNKIIFSNGVKDPEELVDLVKISSWKWGISRHKLPVCLFYEWCWDPGLCLRR